MTSKPVQRRRSLIKGITVAMTAAVLAFQNITLATAQEADKDHLSYVLQELRPAAARMKAMYAKLPPLNAESLPVARKQNSVAMKPQLSDISVEKRVIKDDKGMPDVTVYVINAGADTSRPAILHTHGGGFTMGSPAVDTPTLQEVAKRLDCVIVTVDYRLAPETTWEGSLEDNYAALKWLHTNAAKLGADPGRIAVMGESAGGGHAALLALTARDRGEVPLVAQVLVYPMLDDRTGSSRKVPPHIGTLLWTEETNRFGWNSFLGVEPGSKEVPSAAVPARAENLEGLPPTFIGVGSIDLFVDENIEYAQRLVDAGVSTELWVVPGAFHGFDIIAPDALVSRQFTVLKLDALRRAFWIEQ